MSQIGSRRRAGTLEFRSSPGPAPIETSRARFATVGAAYRLHGAEVYSLIHAMCGPSASEYLTAQMFASLLNAPAVLAFDPAILRSHLLALAHHRALEWLRADAVRQSRSRPLSATAAERAAIARAGADARRLLWRLPRRERQAVVLAYFGGHTCAQVAALLGQSEETVSRCLRTGLVRLGGLAATRTEPTDQLDNGQERRRKELGGELSDLAQLLVGTGGSRVDWAGLAVVAVDTIGACEHAHIVEVEGDASTVVATTDTVPEVEVVHDLATQGLSLDAFAYSRPLYVSDLACDPDWPSFGPHAARREVHSVLVLPLEAPAKAVFNFCSTQPEAFGADDWAGALVVAALADLGPPPQPQPQDQQHQADRLRRGLRARELMAQAQGIVMEHKQLSATDALDTLFDAVRRVSAVFAETLDTN